MESISKKIEEKASLFIIHGNKTTIYAGRANEKSSIFIMSWRWSSHILWQGCGKSRGRCLRLFVSGSGRRTPPKRKYALPMPAVNPYESL